jgi:hypothetical protein
MRGQWVVAMAGFALAGCGSSDKPTAAPAGTTTTAGATTTLTTEAPATISTGVVTTTTVVTPTTLAPTTTKAPRLIYDSKAVREAYATVTVPARWRVDYTFSAGAVSRPQGSTTEPTCQIAIEFTLPDGSAAHLDTITDGGTHGSGSRTYATAGTFRMNRRWTCTNNGSAGITFQVYGLT